MDRAECHYITINRPIKVKANKPWPRYRMVCGEVTRLLSSEAVVERLKNGEWEAAPAI